MSVQGDFKWKLCQNFLERSCHRPVVVYLVQDGNVQCPNVQQVLW